MTLPVFTVVGSLNKILSVPNTDGTLPTTAWSNATVHFSHNMIDGVLEYQGKIYELPDPVSGLVGADGHIVSAYGRPITLLANDSSLNVEGIQWSVVISSGGRTTMWWFDAPLTGQVVDLDTTVPVPNASVVGLIRGLQGEPGIGGVAVENGDGTVSFASGAKAVSSADATKARQVVGLSNVDNTSDVNKPVSTAQAAADLAVANAAAAAQSTANAALPGHIQDKTGATVSGKQMIPTLDEFGNLTDIQIQ